MSFEPESPGPDWLAARHRRLRRLADHARADDTRAVLDLGAGVVHHGDLEPLCLSSVVHLLDPQVRADLVSEHQRLEADLALLAELAESDPDSEDVRLLAAALLDRLREHLGRDERTLYRPLERLREAGSGEI